MGSSVARHRHIRKLREFYRLNKPLFPEAGHWLCLVRREVVDWPGFEERLRSAIAELVAKAGAPTRPAPDGA